MDPNDITPPEFKDTAEDNGREAAVNVIRHKLDHLYDHEPDAKEEAKEIARVEISHLSKHQRYMKKLTDSGKDTAEIQTAWHEYYQGLNDEEKHEVWQEFYSEQAEKKKRDTLDQAKAELSSESTSEQLPSRLHHAKPKVDHARIHRRKPSGSLHNLKKNHHIKSLAFGLSMGCVVVFILLFSFFNERFLVPFIRPSGDVSATPIIVDPNASGEAGPESKIIIPKINVEAPVVYDVKTIEEKDVQAGLERGVVHYATTPTPGEKGNAVIFGHSSGNILNKGKYKFAFILLKSLENDDTFIIQKDGKRYVYKVYKKFVTSPTDFSVLDPTERTAVVTLITCDPPGTSTNRLIIQAEQIFPDPNANTASSVKPNQLGQPEQLPSNSISLWQRIIGIF